MADTIIINVGLAIITVLFVLGIVPFAVKIVRHFRRSPSYAQELARRVADKELSALERVKKWHPDLPKDEQYVVALKSSGQEREKVARRIVADSRKVAATLGEELNFRDVVSRAVVYEYIRKPEKSARNASTLSEITNTVYSIIPTDL
jgi:hypothetical protein